MLLINILKLRSFWIVVLFMVYGLVGNYLQVKALNNFDINMLLFLQNLSLVVSILIIIGILISTISFNYSLKDWGFTLGRGCWVSLALAAIVFMLGYFQDIRGFDTSDSFLAQRIIGASVEELIFRVLLIGTIVRKFGRKWSTVLMAVFLSSLLFTIGHIPTKTTSNLFHLLFSAMIMGYIYYWTRSVLLLLVMHVLGNTAQYSGFFGALTIAGIYFILAVIGEVIERKRGLKTVLE